MYNQLDGDIQRIEPQAQELQQQLVSLEEAIAEVTEKISVLKQQDNSDLEGALNEASAALRELENKRRALRDSSAQMLRGVEFKRQAHEACRDRLYKERMSSERLHGEITSAQAHIREKLGEEMLSTLLDAAQTVERLDDRARGELEGKVSGIRQRLEREGEVDPGVVEQHEIESKRLDDLTNQKDDLLRAAETLQTTLGELSEACTRRFAQTFEAISKNFAYFGPKLFGGGSAELRLIDPSRPLESGVEVLVRPPGKKPKSIDLLSGGEKALCAIALVFSMFMVRPSPLCVLDEVDAPLDEANVHRFVSFIKEMSGRTQFLMITHNKQSMAAADTLVGVTMPTPGASRVLTVSLQEAVKQVA
jgi:chromosome segregation protein